MKIMAWIERTFEGLITSPPPALEQFPVWMLHGPRQVGKSSLLLHCKKPDRVYVNFDDLLTRTRAAQDPIGFQRSLKPPLLIDEIQYAPETLSAVKLLVDEAQYEDRATPGMVWITGSQHFSVMQGVRETLVGRAGMFQLLGLSDEEKGLKSGDPADYFRSIVETSFPSLFGQADTSARAAYLSAYVQTYLERDITALAGVQKRDQFETMLQMLALRTGQELNLTSIAGPLGVSTGALREWIGLVEGTFMIEYLSPWLSNRSKRLTRAPKLHFLDAGLAAYLGGWMDSEQLRLGPQAGAIFESHVIGQVIRYFRHRAIPAKLHFLRTRDGREIDLLISVAGKTYPLEVKLGWPDHRDLYDFSSVAESDWQGGTVVSLAVRSGEGPIRISKHWEAVSPLDLVSLLDSWVGRGPSS